jgi:hypothetical protein
VASLFGHVRGPAQGKPDISRVATGVQGLLCRAITQFQHDEVTAEHPAVCSPEFIGQSLTVFAQSHELALLEPG